MDKRELSHYLRKSFAEIVAKVSDNYGLHSTERLSDFMAGMLGESQHKPLHPLQKPRLLFFPGLSNGPWIDENASEKNCVNR
ncbi:hypothetical protein [Dickeya oryzae]